MKFNKRLIKLQMFANTNVTGDEGMSVEMKTYYDKELIRMAKAQLIHDQFAQTKDIPKNGGKTIEFRKYDPLPKALTPIQEGVTPNGRKMSVKSMTATVDQYGDYIELSDVLDLTAIDNNVLEATDLIGDQAGRTLDTITRDAIAAGTNVIYINNKEGRSSLTAADTLDLVSIQKAATQLKLANAPTINGSYVALINPAASFDLTTSQGWVDVHKYADPTPIFEGEIGKIGNVRFVESTEAKVWKDATCPADGTSSIAFNGEYTFANIFDAAGIAYASQSALLSALDAGKIVYDKMGKDLDRFNNMYFSYDAGFLAVFSTLVIGANAYGTTKVEGGGLKTIIKQLGSAGTGDPLDQRATVGWKAMKVSEILVDAYMVRIESTSAYSTSVDAN